MSGSAASAGGGLVISCAPPSVHQTDGCVKWLSWLRTVTEQNSFSDLLDVCKGVRPGDFVNEEVVGGMGGADEMGKKKVRELELVDIETSQIEDLKAMRMRPHLLPYRRYMYVGEMSLERTTRDRLGAAVSRRKEG